MLKRTYDKIYSLFEKSGGYMPTKEMLKQKISTIHIKELLDNGDIEKVSHGNYWGTFLKIDKPSNYRMIEACLTNSKAVICGPSACYYHGLIEKEPDKLYIATARTDRGGMKLTFPVSRHYYSKSSFTDDIVKFRFHSIDVKVYDVDRSVCDCIRMREAVGENELDEIIRAYKKYPKRNLKKLYEYADKMRVGQIVRSMMQ